MKILLCLNYDIYCDFVLKEILQEFQNFDFKIYFSKKVGRTPNCDELLNLIKCESDGAFNEFENIQESGRNFFTYNKLSKKRYEILGFGNINKDGYEQLKNNNLDLIISVRFGQIFQQPVIDLPKFGVINLHSGLLPKYRGIMASFWAILKGETTIGSTLHYILNQGIDTGDIIEKSYIRVDYSKSLTWHISKIYVDGVLMIIRSINNISNNYGIKSIKQQEFQARYFSYPGQNEINRFLKKMALV